MNTITQIWNAKRAFSNAWLTVTLSFTCSLTSLTAIAQTHSPVELLPELKKGGLVLFMRHGETGPAFADRARTVIGDCATQRNLNDIGRQQNEKMAAALKSMRLPIAKVVSSDFCRSWQTAEALFGKGGYTITDKLTVPLSYPLVNAADTELNNKNLNAMLSEKPSAGSHTFLVSHGINVLLATGYHPDIQGEVVVFRPEGSGKYTRLGSIQQADWSRLASQASKAR
jgi:phosphohistidine phosphatase SixA